MVPVTEIGRFIPHSCGELRIALNNDDLNDEISIQVDDELQNEMFTNSTVQVRKDNKNHIISQMLHLIDKPTLSPSVTYSPMRYHT